MKFVHFVFENTKHLGVLKNEDCKNLEIICFKDLGINAKTMNDFIIDYEHYSAFLEGLNKVSSIKVPRQNLLAPIEEPLQDIICLGINFLDHAKESAKFKGEAFEERGYPVYFGKRVNCASAPYGILPLHEDITKQLDYECELAFILAKEAYKIKAKQAYEYIFGYTIINDLSARELQARHKQFYRAKSLESSTIMGPYIVKSEDIAYPPKLDLKSYVNGELRQNSNTEFFIFDIAYVLEELSASMRLKAGSIISMGTPSGVGMGFNPPKFLKDGDIVRCEIENIGYICNTIKAQDL